MKAKRVCIAYLLFPHWLGVLAVKKNVEMFSRYSCSAELKCFAELKWREVFGVSSCIVGGEITYKHVFFFIWVVYYSGAENDEENLSCDGVLNLY